MVGTAAGSGRAFQRRLRTSFPAAPQDELSSGASRASRFIPDRKPGTAAGRFPHLAALILGLAAKTPKRWDGGGLRTSFPVAPPGPRDSSRTESYDRLKRARWLGEGVKQLIAPHLTGAMIPALMHWIPSELRS
ncbi:hypothetical protein VNO77_27128 [Canavalia gladiata]|uniref:Uncharacterized protein n=1 Tax=Canavalia gladiata TaxID=3824 RepID=A0AAN9Q3X7_CANGL